MPAPSSSSTSKDWACAASQMDDEDIWLNVTFPTTIQNDGRNDNDNNENNNNDGATSSSASTKMLLSRGLQDLERQLRCRICQEFYTAPISLESCHHSFCSECIRQTITSCLTSIRRQANCPICNERIDFKKLVPNRSLEELTRTFKNVLREPLKTVLLRPGAAADGSCESDGDRESPRQLQLQADSQKESEVSAIKCPDPSTDPTANTKDTDTLLRPDCRRLEKKGKVHYKNMKYKDLVALCNKEGLWTNGSQQQLMERHREFLNLYQAECDSFHPRTQKQLVELVHERERARQKEHGRDQRREREQKKFIQHSQSLSQSSSTTTMTMDNTSTNSSAAPVGLNDDGFKKLIQQEKERRKQKLLQKQQQQEQESSTKTEDETSPEKEPQKYLHGCGHAPQANHDEEKQTSNVDQNVENGSSTDNVDSRAVASSSSPSPLCKRRNSDMSPDERSATVAKEPDTTTTKRIRLENSLYSSSPAAQLEPASSPTRRAAMTTVTKEESASIDELSQSTTITGGSVAEDDGTAIITTTTTTGTTFPAASKRRSTSGVRSNSKSKSQAPWSCNACTFINHVSLWKGAKCGMCGTPRSPSSTLTKSPSSATANTTSTITIDN